MSTSTKAKAECPVSREAFQGAKSLAVEVRNVGAEASRTLSVAPRTFSTGTLGWYGGDKVTVMVGGVEVRCQVDIKVYVIGSKELPAAMAKAA